jgi:hypothetical protein
MVLRLCYARHCQLTIVDEACHESGGAPVATQRQIFQVGIFAKPARRRRRPVDTLVTGMKDFPQMCGNAQTAHTL